MIRTIVVEDEPFASRRICRLIKLLDEDFEIVGTAMDGKAALEMLETVECDLVITDIRMPMMNGIELISMIRQMNKQIMSVVVSGFSDFQYVSSALREDALDYLLKPVSQEDMKALLKRVKEKYLTRVEKEKFSALAGLLNKSAPRRATQIEVLKDERLLVCLFCAGPMPMCENADMCPGAKYWEDTSLKEAFFKECAGNIWEFTGDTSAERIIIMEASAIDFGAMLQGVVDRLNALADVPISCAYNASSVKASEISAVLRRLRQTLQNSIVLGKGLLLDGTRAREEHEIAKDEIQMAQSLLTSTGAPIENQLLSQRHTQRELYLLFDAALSGLIAQKRVMEADEAMLRKLLKESVSTALSASELFSDLQGLCAVAEGAKQDASASAFSDMITLYLEENYSSHITNQTLSAHFGYVPSYLSRLFQQEKGISPVEYLTDVRMRHAKELMELEPEMLIKDIAVSVGFKNQFHFSRLFKKYEGINPTDYRTNK